MVHLTTAIEFNKRRHLVAPADAGQDKLAAACLIPLASFVVGSEGKLDRP
jgi:hypothetical protein